MLSSGHHQEVSFPSNMLRKTLPASRLQSTSVNLSPAGLKPRIDNATSYCKRGLFLLFYKQGRTSLVLVFFIVFSIAILVGGFMLVFLPDGAEIETPKNPQASGRQQNGSNQIIHLPGTAAIYSKEHRRNEDSTAAREQEMRTFEGLPESNFSSEARQKFHSRGIVMSCPVGQSQTHRGHWKPRKMILGVEAVIKQLESFKSNLPLLFGYYDSEIGSAKQWCRNVSNTYVGSVNVDCFQVSFSAVETPLISLWTYTIVQTNQVVKFEDHRYLRNTLRHSTDTRRSLQLSMRRQTRFFG